MNTQCYTIVQLLSHFYIISSPSSLWSLCVVTADYQLSQLNISDEILKKELCRL